ncbi:MAG: replication endonuclease [Sulfuricellaceae bacterium]
MNQQAIQDRAYFETLRKWGHPNISEEISLAVADKTSRPFVAAQLAQVPGRFHPHFLDEYATYQATAGTAQANTWIRETVEKTFPAKGLPLTAGEDEIRRAAEARAAFFRSILAGVGTVTSETLWATLTEACRRLETEPPRCKKLDGLIGRLTDYRWWRKTLRRRTMRTREAGAIKAGFVHRKAGLYASDETMARHRQHRKLGAQYLEMMEAINELGEIFTLDEIAAGNVSNPAVRRAELMVRIKGMEAYAQGKGLRALFVTWTCPSRMHSRRDNGTPNPKYDTTTPALAHRHLQAQWAKARAKLKREGVNCFGLRVEEPHHDGTPHRHILLFVHPLQVGRLTAILTRYALEHDADEPGAQKHRLTVERIDPAKGSAAGYVAKYIAKNVDGEHVGLDFEANGESAATTAERVNAWAATWGIRQFQFFGGQKVTPWRELRRLREEPQGEFSAPWFHADRGDWDGYTRAMEEAPLALWTEPRPSLRYAGEESTIIKGLEFGPEKLKTRVHEWRIEPKAGAFAPPWTRVNNCTRHPDAPPEPGKKNAAPGSFKPGSGGKLPGQA